MTAVLAISSRRRRRYPGADIGIAPDAGSSGPEAVDGGEERRARYVGERGKTFWVLLMTVMPLR